jgi:hypothetical protein
METENSPRATLPVSVSIRVESMPPALEARGESQRVFYHLPETLGRWALLAHGCQPEQPMSDRSNPLLPPAASPALRASERTSPDLSGFDVGVHSVAGSFQCSGRPLQGSPNNPEAPTVDG